MILLLTRPSAQSARFAQEFVARFGTGAEIICSPVMKIVPLDAPLALDGITGLIFTSVNAVECFAARCGNRQLSAYCVGQRTARAARDIGLITIATAADADALVVTISSHKPGGRLLHLRGMNARGAVAGRLSDAGQPCREQVIYDQIPQELSHFARNALRGDTLVLLPLFSPRSAALVAGAMDDAAAPLALVTMSRAVTNAWTGPAPVVLRQAATPDAAAMLDALASAIDAVQRLEGRQPPG